MYRYLIYICQVNYLAHFLVVMKLLPVMYQSGPDCRVVLVSSVAHNWATFDLDKIQARQYNEANFDRAEYYYKSKLYQVRWSLSTPPPPHSLSLSLCSFYAVFMQFLSLYCIQNPRRGWKTTNKQGKM